MKVSLKKIDVGSAVKFIVWYTVIISTIMGIVFGLVASAQFGRLGWGIMVLIPIFYSVMALVLGTVLVIFINFILKKTGGIKFEFDKNS